MIYHWNHQSHNVSLGHGRSAHLISAHFNHDSAKQANFSQPDFTQASAAGFHCRAKMLSKSSSTQLAFGEPTRNLSRIHYTKAAAGLGMLCKVLRGRKVWLRLSIPLYAQSLIQQAFAPTWTQVRFAPQVPPEEQSCLSILAK